MSLLHAKTVEAEFLGPNSAVHYFPQPVGGRRDLAGDRVRQVRDPGGGKELHAITAAAAAGQSAAR